ncbi:uncharacterized LOC128706665 homolog [Hyla sarda]|uniref:uncharacterized LOC128706665 homolog n=1 Tax=Hyla sarda TaxID=327740 RepID=UPI0024C316E0|nr:uncharacterized LOC128706665 homolog [Hyla sarda]
MAGGVITAPGREGDLSAGCRFFLNLCDIAGCSEQCRLMSMMGLGSIWKSYKVLIIMVPSIGVIHWGWYNMQSSPVFHPEGKGRLPLIFQFLSRKDMDTKDK